MADVKKLEASLWDAADDLRANSKLTSNQYCMPVLGLIFLRYAWGRFKVVEAELMKNRPVRRGRVMPIEPLDFKAKNALYLPENARYDYLLSLKEEDDIGKAVNDAMEAIEQVAPQLAGVLPTNYKDFPKSLLSAMLRLFNNTELDDLGGDVLGQIYEYFLNKFAKNIASDDGVFFTPKSLVKMIVNVLEPKRGILLDPACGSGGMFVQTGDFVAAHGTAANNVMTFYGQEKVEYNAQLCLMNMAVHGLNGRIHAGNDANTFYHDVEHLEGECDYVMANPPFNVDKVNAENTEKAGRLPFGLPSVNKAKEIGNANYLWISYFYAYLNDHGRAGFVMASSATDSSRKDKDIRQKLVETGAVDVMIAVGNNFFYTKSLPCTLWFFDKGKPEERKDKVLMIDAREYYTVVDRTQNTWSDWQLANLHALVWLYRGEVEKYKALIETYRSILRAYGDRTEGAPALGEDFGADVAAMEAYQKTLEQKAAAEVAAAKKSKDKEIKKNWKSLEAKWNARIEAAKDTLTTAKEADWLYSKFGDGTWQDIPGLCCIVNRKTIEDRHWSLTPGAYVGVAPEPDDGVDFGMRMKEIHKELTTLQAESNTLMDRIIKNLEDMGL